MFKKKDQEEQRSMWITTSEIVRSPSSDYYDRLDQVLKEVEFGNRVRKMSEPYYSMEKSAGGRKGIDPEVYFKMLMVGFFENIGSERGIASRCADSIAIRGFMNYELWEHTPDHSSLSRIRKRLGKEAYEATVPAPASCTRFPHPFPSRFPSRSPPPFPRTHAGRTIVGHSRSVIGKVSEGLAQHPSFDRGRVTCTIVQDQESHHAVPSKNPRRLRRLHRPTLVVRPGLARPGSTHAGLHV